MEYIRKLRTEAKAAKDEGYDLIPIIDAEVYLYNDSEDKNLYAKGSPERLYFDLQQVIDWDNSETVGR